MASCAGHAAQPQAWAPDSYRHQRRHQVAWALARRSCAKLSCMLMQGPSEGRAQAPVQFPCCCSGLSAIAAGSTSRLTGANVAGCKRPDSWLTSCRGSVNLGIVVVQPMLAAGAVRAVYWCRLKAVSQF
jgi:hypothetical protein